MKQVTDERGLQSIEHEHYASGPTHGARLLAQSPVMREPCLWVGAEHHLNREQVTELVSLLQHWLQTGCLFPPAESPADNTAA